VTSRIELVPSVIILPSRQTVLVAKQAAELDILTGGRLRLGIGIGNNADEYRALGQDFSTRGARCEEQIRLLRLLWSQETVEFEGRWDVVSKAGINPLPTRKSIPIWIGTTSNPVPRVIKRLGRQSDGWFVICSPAEYPGIMRRIREEAESIDRDPDSIGSEAGVAVVGPRESEWQDRVIGWREAGLTHLCLRTLGGNLSPTEHLSVMARIVDELP
jgi:probable F420-dependent oxidoreductase